MRNFYPKKTDSILTVSLIVLAFSCYDNSRIEENKNRTPAVALNKLLDSDTSKGIAKMLRADFFEENTNITPAFNKTIEDMYNNKHIREFIEAE